MYVLIGSVVSEICRRVHFHDEIVANPVRNNFLPTGKH